MKVTQAVYSIVVVGMLAGATTPLAAQTVAECYAKVLNMCSDAMVGANWFERFAIAEVCTALLVGCNTSIVVGK